MQNLYEFLGLPEEASFEDIRKAYRRLAKQYHPDSGNGDEEAFRRINQAYNVLSRPESRNDYDKTLRNYRSRTGSVDSYTADRIEVSGEQIQRLLEEMVRQTNLASPRRQAEDSAAPARPRHSAKRISISFPSRRMAWTITFGDVWRNDLAGAAFLPVTTMGGLLYSQAKCGIRAWSQAPSCATSAYLSTFFPFPLNQGLGHP